METVSNNASDLMRLLMESPKGFPVIITEGTRFVEGSYCGSGFVDYGGKTDGVILSTELSSLQLERDAKYRFMVVDREGDLDDGVVTLSFLKAKVWADAQAAAESGVSLKVIPHRVARRRKDKVICGMDVLLLGDDGRPALKAFIPRSEIFSERMQNEQFESMVNTLAHSSEPVDAKVLKVSDNIVLSLARAQRTNKLDEAKVGDLYVARVVSIQAYGALVDIGGFSGLVHISEMPNRNAHCVKVGETVEVTVIDIDRDRERMEFSLTAKRKNEMFATLKVGMELEGIVRHNADPGTFVVLDADAGLDGLLPHRGYPQTGQPKVGDKVRVRIFNIDHDRGRIGLTMRGVRNDAPSADSRPQE